ncbi:MAG TPA: Ig-like domain-containing protein [Longimicrobium sp.]|nr:Ig-like domain-containing protein [Longimicrobium sp.]
MTTHANPRPARRSGRMTRRITAFLSFLALAACGDGRGPLDTGAAEVAAVEVTAPAETMDMGASMQLSATPRSRSGAAVPGAAVTWTSSDEAVAAVSASGLVTAFAPGRAILRATSGGRTGEMAVTVAPRPVASLEILPGGEVVLDPGAAAQLQAVARTAAGAPVSGVAVAWSSSDAGVAQVTETGAVRGGMPGTATITASAGGRAAQVAVRVWPQVASVVVLPGGPSLAVGGTVQLRARGITAAGDTVPRPVAWASENEGVATVDAAGTVTARRPGSAVIRATVGGVAGRAIVIVHGTTEQRLERAGGQPLPARIGTRSFRDAAGVLHEQRVMVTGGVLRMGGGYEQRLTLEVFEGDVRVSTETYEDRGQVMYNVFTGEPLFGSTLRPGLRFTGRFLEQDGLPTGETATTQTLGGEGTEVELLFGQP